VFKIADAIGSGGCNDWYSPYRYDPSSGRIAFDQVAMTARGCANAAAGPVEEAFAKALVAVTSASIDPAGRLVLSGTGGEVVLAVDVIQVEPSAGSGDGNQ
jgi:heat shock protein HslJ